MKLSKNKKKWTGILLVSGLIASLAVSQWNVYASYQESTYYDRMLSGFEYDQNDFKELVSNKVIAPTNLTSSASFTSGIKYNAYRPDGNSGSAMTIKEMNASSESVITTSFWMNLKQSGEIGIMPFSVGTYSLYHINGRFGFNTFGHDVYGVDMDRTSGDWVHVIATFNKGDINKNTLYLNGKKQNITHSSSPLKPPIPERATWNDSSVVNMGGHPSYPLKDDSMVDEFHILRGGVDEVDAKNLYSLSRVPELNAFNENNKAKLEWAVSTFNPNPFYKTSFESGDDMPTKPKDEFNTLSLYSADAYNGSNSIQYKNTTELKGNGYFYPNTTANRSYVHFAERKYVPNGTPISVSFKAKSNKRAVVQPTGEGGVASATIDHHKVYGGNPKVFMEDALKGSKVIKVSHTSEIPQRAGVWVADRYIPVARDAGPYYSYIEIEKIDVAKNLIYLKKGLAEDFKAGQILQGHRNVRPIAFPSQVVEGDGQWKNININTTVQNYDYYDTMIRGFRLYLYAETAGTLQIDDVELVEATRADLYRGDTLIYSGYNSQFVDSQAIDKAVPNKPQTKKIEIANNVAKVTLLKPDDKGTTYDYKMQGVTSDGTKTVYSDAKKVEIKSGIKGYSYVVNSSPSTIPSATSNTTSETISVPHANDAGTRYLHVRAIDNQGNAGDTTHIKLALPLTTAIPSLDGMYTDLSWSFDLNSETFGYKVYTRQKGGSTYTTKTTNNKTLKETTTIDVARPAIISKPVFKRNPDGSYLAEFQPVKDNGTVYEYYIEAIGNDTGSVYTSPVKEVKVQSDVKGYAIEVSKSKTPNLSTVTATTSPISFTVPESTLIGDEGFYVHMKAIDGVGNQSIHTTYYQSSTAYLVITPSTTDWTNKSVTLTITGSQGIGAIKMLHLPNGSVVNSSTATFVVSENGSYPFYGQDEFGQWITGGFTVSNIDKATPLIDAPNLSPDWVNQDINVLIKAE